MALRVERTPGMAAATVVLLSLKMAVAAREDTLVPVARVLGLQVLLLPVLAAGVAVLAQVPANMLTAAAVLAFTDKGLTVRRVELPVLAAAGLVVPMAVLGFSFATAIAAPAVTAGMVALTAAAVVTHSQMVALEPQEPSASYGPAPHVLSRLQKQDRFVLPSHLRQQAHSLFRLALQNLK